MTHSLPSRPLVLMFPILVIVLSFLTVSASAQEGASADKITNQMCPVTTDEEIDPEFFLETDEGRVYFCCAKCRRRYIRTPEKYAESLAQVLPALFQAGIKDQDTHADDHDDQEQAQTPAEDTPEQVAAEDADNHDAAEGDHDETEGDHDHNAHETGSGFLAKLLGWFGNFHPPSTHFPVAMLFGAALGEMMYRVTRRSVFASGARFCLWFAIPGAVSAAILGWFYAGFAVSDGDWIMTTHRWLGTATALLAVTVLGVGWGRVVRGEGDASRMYLVLLGLAAGAVGLNGFLGGALVYGLDHYAF